MPLHESPISPAKAIQRPAKVTIDFETAEIVLDGPNGKVTHSLSSPEGFAAVSDAWLRAGWDAKYVYSFSWFGRPIIQLPEDMVRMQELVYSVKPDVIVETGIAHGGSAIFYASQLKAMGKGRVVAVDIEIRKHNRTAIEQHELFDLITLIEGDSTADAVVAQVGAQIKPGEKVLLVLDSNHTKEHVLKELNAYSKFVSVDSYIVAFDGIMEQVVGAPRTDASWTWNNPKQAVQEFVNQNPNFVIEEPQFPFNEGFVKERVTYAPMGIIRRVR